MEGITSRYDGLRGPELLSELKGSYVETLEPGHLPPPNEVVEKTEAAIKEALDEAAMNVGLPNGEQFAVHYPEDAATIRARTRARFGIWEGTSEHSSES